MKCAEMHKDAQEGAQCHFTFVLSAVLTKKPPVSQALTGDFPFLTYKTTNKKG